MRSRLRSQTPALTQLHKTRDSNQLLSIPWGAVSAPCLHSQGTQQQNSCLPFSGPMLDSTTFWTSLPPIQSSPRARPGNTTFRPATCSAQVGHIPLPCPGAWGCCTGQDMQTLPLPYFGWSKAVAATCPVHTWGLLCWPTLADSLACPVTSFKIPHSPAKA